MSEQNNDVSNVSSQVSDDAVNPTQDQDKTVSYDSYSKALNQRKADQQKLREANERLAQFEAEKKAAEEASLKEQSKWKELYEKKEQEANEFKNRFLEVETSIVRAEKIDAFERAAGAPLKHQAFTNHINLDAIQMSESGEIDLESLNTVVGEFKNTFGESLFDTKQAKALPSGAAKQSPAKSFKDLSTDEIKAKLKELG